MAAYSQIFIKVLGGETFPLPYREDISSDDLYAMLAERGYHYPNDRIIIEGKQINPGDPLPNLARINSVHLSHKPSPQQTLEAEIKKIQEQITAKQKQFRTIPDEIEALQERIYSKEAELAALPDQIAALEADLAALRRQSRAPAASTSRSIGTFTGR